MSEKRYKRFYVSESENQLTIYDNEGLDDYYHLGNDERDVKGICKLLNEQQATIKKLEEEIKLLKPTNIEQYEQIVQLQKENEQLQAQLREKEQDEQLYANEILELREANKEFIQFKELGGDY